ncbi:molybdopterin molybdotransferase MoeA [Halosimplex sp. J119]
MTDPRRAAADRPPLPEALDRLRQVVAPIDRTERLPVSTAVGRTLAEPVTARRAVPGYDQAARDGVALRAADTAGANGDEPVDLDAGSGPVESGTGVAVEAGDELPDGADAVVGVGGLASGSPSGSSESEGGSDGEFTVVRSVEPGTGVRGAGSDIAADETVRPAGHRIRPSDPALCAAAGRTRVEVVQRPTAGIVPTGGGVVDGDPEPGETVETTGTTVAEFAERFGAKVTYRDPVDPDPHALRAAVQRDLTRDLLVTIGGTGAGESDRIVDVIADLGEVEVDCVGLDPGGTTALSVVDERPVLSIPGDPVAAFVATTQLVAPAVARLAGREPPAPTTLEAELAADIESAAGRTSIVPVAFEDDGAAVAGARTARPITGEPLSTIARADGWVAAGSDRGGLPAGETVSVERWEASI